MRFARVALSRMFFAALLGCCGAAGCGDSEAPGSAASSVQLHLSSAPSGDYQALHLDIARIDALGTMADGQRGWVIFGTPDRIVDFASNAPMDVTLAAQRALPAGHYDEVRLIFGPKSTVTLNDNSLHALMATGDAQSGIPLPASFDVTADRASIAEGSVSLDAITAGQSDRGSMICVLHHDDDPPGCQGGSSGTLSGTLTDKASGAALAGVALFGEEVDASGRATIVSTAVTSVQGTYTMTMLPLGHTYYVVTRPYVNGVIYAPQASDGLSLSSRATSARFSVKLSASDGVNGTGGVSGQVVPTAASNQSDQLNLVRQFGGSDSPWLIVDTTIGQLGTLESYAFSAVPLGRYAVWSTRSVVQLDGTVSATSSAKSQPFNVVAGSTANAILQYP